MCRYRNESTGFSRMVGVHQAVVENVLREPGVLREDQGPDQEPAVQAREAEQEDGQPAARRNGHHDGDELQREARPAGPEHLPVFALRHHLDGFLAGNPQGVKDEDGEEGDSASQVEERPLSTFHSFTGRGAWISRSVSLMIVHAWWCMCRHRVRVVARKSIAAVMKNMILFSAFVLNAVPCRLSCRWELFMLY